MKIENLREEENSGATRIAATVMWEDCDRPVEEIYFEARGEFADSLSCNPDAFLLACAGPAMHYGEKRLRIDGEVCPELRAGALTALSWIRHWRYATNHDLIHIDAPTRRHVRGSASGKRAGFFFSGGIDSYATLFRNRLHYQTDHPWFIRDALLVYGLEVDDTQSFEYVSDLLASVGRHFELTLIPVYTNIYLNYRQEDATRDFAFWIYEFGGAALAAVAHALQRRLSVASIAATFDLPNLAVWGSHPLLDPNYSSHELQIRHDGLEMSRLEKIRLVAHWDIALRKLRVCNSFKRYRPGELNCGGCEKCIRTMLGLLVVGALDRATAFPKSELSPEDIKRGVSIPDAYVESCYRELIDPLIKIGRPDLALEIKRKLASAKRKVVPLLKGKIQQIDHRYFRGHLRRLKRRFSG